HEARILAPRSHVRGFFVARGEPTLCGEDAGDHEPEDRERDHDFEERESALHGPRSSRSDASLSSTGSFSATAPLLIVVVPVSGATMTVIDDASSFSTLDFKTIEARSVMPPGQK